MKTAPSLCARDLSVVLTLGLGAFFTNLDVTAVVVALPAMEHTLNFGMAATAWVIDAYSLAFTGMLLAAGAIADRFGRRRALLAGNAIFLVASLACGLAWDGPSLWLARGLQGAGAAFVVTGALALVASAFPDAAVRARVFALMGVVSGVGMAVGPTLGGVITAWTGWRWIFFINVPFCVALTIAVPRLVVEGQAAEKRSLDIVGVVLLTMALALLIDATLRVRVDMIGAASLGGAALLLLAGFALQQRRCVVPLLDPAVFGTPAMIGVGLLLIAVSVSYWAILVYLPPAMQSAFGWHADRTGLALLAATAPMLIVPPIGGHLVMRIGWRWHFAHSLAILAVGNLLLLASLWRTDTAETLGLMLAGMVVIGSGAALAHPQLSGALLALAPADRSGMASAMTIVARQGGFALGIAALAVVGGGHAFEAIFATAASIAVLGALAAIFLLPADR
ncbi:MFS transporter permease [Bradyrhizobium nitroreducens]|uniref:MFS transporter permease n=1 Tax=Bradyrhizobium nitroreducens TaxID=709803 RepID=A0A2M6UN68_9BRAD|nr:MFS transporter permease [Bradyrhizobium nitroreducens]